MQPLTEKQIGFSISRFFNFIMTLKGLGHDKIEGCDFLIIANVKYHSNGKLFYFSQNVCVTGIFKAIQDNREGFDLRKCVIQLCTTIL